jgi:hypothetical protein
VQPAPIGTRAQLALERFRLRHGGVGRDGDEGIQPGLQRLDALPARPREAGTSQLSRAQTVRGFVDGYGQLHGAMRRTGSAFRV